MTNKDILWCCALLALLLTLAMITGCSSVVKIPISEPCTPAEVKPIPQSPLEKINNNSTLPEVAQAYFKEVQLRKGYTTYVAPK